MQARIPIPHVDSSLEDVALTNDLIFSMSRALDALDPDEVLAAAMLIERGLRDRRKILLMGNGGSCATASHLATDLMLIAREARLCASIRPLNDNASLLSAVTNDYGFAESGAVLVEANASPGDILIIFSCSVRSPNLLQAAYAADRIGMVTLLVGSSIAPADFPTRSSIVIESKHYSVIETVHLAVSHLLADLVRQRLGVQSARCARHLLRKRRASD
jgi:D-sedoheptulose 7-phosphate isomerase